MADVGSDCGSGLATATMLRWFGQVLLTTYDIVRSNLPDFVRIDWEV